MAVSGWKRVKSQEWTKDILVSSIDINNVLTDPPPNCSTKLQQQQKASSRTARLHRVLLISHQEVDTVAVG